MFYHSAPWKNFFRTDGVEVPLILLINNLRKGLNYVEFDLGFLLNVSRGMCRSILTFSYHLKLKITIITRKTILFQAIITMQMYNFDNSYRKFLLISKSPFTIQWVILRKVLGIKCFPSTSFSVAICSAQTGSWIGTGGKILVRFHWNLHSFTVCVYYKPENNVFFYHVKQVVDHISVPWVWPIYTNKCFSVGFSYLRFEKMTVPAN